MLTILFWILKALGILILAILLLLLLLILVVLLTPIRYRLQGQKKEEISGAFRVSWLFGFLKAEGVWKEKEEPKVRILIGGKPLGEKKKKKKKRAKKQPDILYTREKKEEFPEKEEDVSKEAVSPVKETAAESVKPEQTPAEPILEEPPVLQEKTEEKQSVPERKKEGIRRVKLEEIEEVPPPVLQEEDFLEDEAFFTGTEEAEEEESSFDWKILLKIEDKKGIAKAFGKLLKRMAKGILPRDFYVKGTFGTGDPVLTGYLMAVLGILKGKFGEDLQVKGDFGKRTAENMVVRVEGKIVAGYLVYAGLAFVLAKPVRRVLILLWKGRKKHGERI